MSDEATCSCYCHVVAGATCTIDSGYGAPGVPYCGPHLSGPLCNMTHGWTEQGHPQYKQARVGLLCMGHRRRLDDTSLEIELLVIDLVRCREAGTTPHEARGRKEHRKIDDAPPVPVNLDWVMLTDHRTGQTHDRVMTPEHPIGIPAVLDTYCRRLGLGHMARRDHILGRLDVLRRHHDWIAEHDWVIDYAADLSGVRRALRTAVRDQTHSDIGRCYLPVDEAGREQCIGRLLAENGTGIVRCTQCRAQWSTPQELARLRVTLG